MYYTRHYSITPCNDELRSLLETEYSIPVEVTMKSLTRSASRMIFDISEQHPRFRELEHILPPETTTEQLEEQFRHCQETGEVVSDCVTIICQENYTKEEFENAKWLTVRNITCKITPANCETIDTYQCFVNNSKLGRPLGCHEIQNEPYVLSAPVKWGRRAFVSAYCHEERLFCNDTVRAMLTAQGIVGIDFCSVMRKSTGQPMDGVSQIVPVHTVPDGAMVAISGMDEYICKQCGMHMLRYTRGGGRYGLLEGILDEQIDVWQTQPMFLGRNQNICHSASTKLIISQRMYRFLIENKFDRGFVFAPLEMIER